MHDAFKMMKENLIIFMPSMGIERRTFMTKKVYLPCILSKELLENAYH